jgi:hypothetical protein
MAERDELLRAVRAAQTGDEMITAVAALDEHDQARTAAIARSRETDLSATAVRATLEPVPLYERHTAATDWLGEYEAPVDYRTAMITEASRWYRSLPPGVEADPEEFREQALGQAYTAASAYGSQALDARREFMTYVGYLTRRGASGLPQVDQEVDSHDNQAPTPYPAETFDNFAPEQNEYNTQVESPSGQSQVSSERAPMMQQLEQQDGSGSGFGSGAANPNEHSTAMDVANSYAEIPLGMPGEIPTVPPPGAAPSAPSTPNPALGQNMDEGSERRPNVIASALTGPDSEGFRWQFGADAGDMTFDGPFHSRCSSWHWPEQDCGRGTEHTASLAVGYVMNAEDFARRARFESLGVQEGHAILRLGNLAKVAAHRDALMAGFRVQARTEDEIAWLHGYLARVGPVLARGAVPSDDNPALSGTCPGCGGKPGKNGGLCKNCVANGVKSKKKKGKAKAGSRLDFREAPSGLTAEGMRKGAPFAGYKDFAACVAANQDKNDPEAYCGKIKHQVEGAVHPEDRAWSNEPGGYYGNHGGNAGGYSGNEGHYSEGYEGSDVDVPHHLRGSFQELWRDDPDSWSHRDPTDADREAFRRHVQQHYDPEVYRAYFRHQGASSLTQIQETVDSHDNPNPGADQLNTAVMFPLAGQEGDQDDQSKEAARSSMTPSSAAVKMFGRMDAMEGKRPRHKDNYAFSTKAHGQYMRGWNETRGVMDATLGRDPIGRDDYAEWSGRPDLHQHYLGVYSEMKGRQGDRPDYHAAPGERVSGVLSGQEDLRQKEGLRRQADTMTKPHQSTDDGSPPFNTAQTTPEPPGADYSQGIRDGQEDAASGEHPTFADNSSLVSPYVKGYAVGYSGRPPDTGAQDVPRSMGGDSGQAMNAGEAQRAFQVSRASLQRTAAQCYGCPHPAHRTEPCNAEGCQHLHNPGEEGAGPGMHARTIGHVPDPGAPGYSMPRGGRPSQRSSVRRQAHDFTESERENAAHSLGPDDKLPVNSKQDLKNAHTRAHQVKGIPESTVDSYLDRLDKEYGYGGEHAHDRRAASLRRVSAAFLTREVAADPEFRRGYKFAARWTPGMNLVSQGSPAFEAGLYAAIADRPDAQEAWAGEHYRLSRAHPVLGRRLDAHSSFTVKFARAHADRYHISGNGYLVPAVARRGPAHQGKARQVTAGTTVDLITDGPGTSPDPMGSTPLNGPGQPPPMGGGEDPARSGGVPPYQGAPPPASAPVAPDDMLGTPQEAPQKSGPFTQTFSGRQPGNADLAPAAPNTADATGYENTDAYQGDPMRVHRTMAFRRTVQAALAARS